MSKAVTKKQAQEVAAVNDMFGERAGAGTENVTAKDILIPRLTILQSTSPQIVKPAQKIEGAAIGDICDLGLGELFKDGIVFIPVFYRKDYIHWAPRDSDKSLLGIFPDESILEQCDKVETTGGGTQMQLRGSDVPGSYIEETAQFFGINLTAGGRLSVIPMKSTQLKKARQWLTMATGEELKRGDGSKFTPPLWYRTYHLTTADESNAKGDWKGWVVKRGISMPELDAATFGPWAALYEKCDVFLGQLVAGQADIDPEQMDDRAPAEGDGPIIEGQATQTEAAM